MTGPTWAILVPTIGERRAAFERLMAGLLPQTEPFGGQVRVLSWWNNGDPHLTEIRQAMNERAGTDYVSCVDDDDLVEPDYVPAIMEALARRPEYVGFQVQCYSDGVPTAISHHTITNTGWWNEPRRYFRDFSHLNPIRRDLALRANFRRAKPGQAEDRAWVAQLRRVGITDEVMIPRVMYHYLFSTSRTAGVGSRWVRGARPGQYEPAPIEHPNFAYLEGGPRG